MDTFALSDPLISSTDNISNMFEFSIMGPPSPPWDEDDLMDFKLSPVSESIEPGSSDVDEFLSYSPSSLRLDSDTDEAISTFLKTGQEIDDKKPVMLWRDVDVTTCDDSILCSACHTSFSSLDEMSRHVCDIMDVIFSDESMTNSESSVWKELCEADSLTSMVCESPTNKHRSLEISISDHSTLSEELVATEDSSSVVTSQVGHCSVCKLVFASSEKLEAHKKNFASKFVCCHCNKSFANVSKLRIHHRKHSKEKPFQCRCCGKYYTHRNTLVRHQQTYCVPLRAKTKETDFKSDRRAVPKVGVASAVKVCTPKPEKSSCTLCKICDKDFFDVLSLENHRDYHLKQRTCCKCNKTMGNKSKLLIHHRSHTKELPYACSVCDKSFAEKSTLTKHAATHGERNFQCHVCEKAFVRKDYLAKHLLTHRQTYKCSQCSFICYERLDIEKHVAEHQSL